MLNSTADSISANEVVFGQSRLPLPEVALDSEIAWLQNSQVTNASSGEEPIAPPADGTTREPDLLRTTIFRGIYRDTFRHMSRVLLRVLSRGICVERLVVESVVCLLRLAAKGLDGPNLGMCLRRNRTLYV